MNTLSLVKKALEARSSVWENKDVPTDSYRLIDGQADGFKGLSIDRFAERLLIASAQDKSRLDLEELISALQELEGISSIWWKQLEQDEKKSPELLWATEKDEQPFVISENGLRYEIDFTAGYSQGIFLDQRENRQAIREYCQRRLKEGA